MSVHLILLKVNQLFNQFVWFFISEKRFMFVYLTKPRRLITKTGQTHNRAAFAKAALQESTISWLLPKEVLSSIIYIRKFTVAKSIF